MNRSKQRKLPGIPVVAGVLIVVQVPILLAVLQPPLLEALGAGVYAILAIEALTTVGVLAVYAYVRNRRQRDDS